MDLDPGIMPTLDTLNKTSQSGQAQQNGVWPRLARGTNRKNIARPVVRVSAGEEVDILDRIGKRIELIGNEESYKLDISNRPRARAKRVPLRVSTLG